MFAAFLVNSQRPRNETAQPSAAFVRASGKCAECHYRQQYFPVWFSIFAPPAAAGRSFFSDSKGKTALLERPRPLRRLDIRFGGLSGVIFHLHSQFFCERTLKSLTYVAPFPAPLAYTGLGLLLIMNRMVSSRSVEWAQWLIALSAGGFAGNFVLCLTDHAVNGFYRPEEWIPVISAAFATAFLTLHRSWYR